jgi:hypothetical protein
MHQHVGRFLASLHPMAWKEIDAMARRLGKPLKFDIRPAVESLGMEEFINQVGIGRIIDHVGLDRILEYWGKKAIIKYIGWEVFVASLSPAERRELKRRLQ